MNKQCACCEANPGQMAPPVDVVLVCEPPNSSSSVHSLNSISSSCEPPATEMESQASRASFATVFRLQPRTVVKCTPSPTSGACRGRKRRAHSISTEALAKGCAMRASPAFSNEAVDSDTEASTLETISHKPVPSSTLCTPSSRVECTALNLQGLSLRSPQPTAEMTTDSKSPGSLICPRMSSSFSKYSHSSPRERSIKATTLFARTSSPGSSVSSQKFAPLTVLTNDDSKTNKRPPLPSGGHSMLFSFVQNAPREPLLSTPEAERIFTEARATKNFEPSSDTSTLDTTPLPRVVLTPRSTFSTNSRNSEFPLFPSPTAEDLFSPFEASSFCSSGAFQQVVPSLKDGDSGSSRRKSDQVNLPQAKSFIPLPDWGKQSVVPQQIADSAAAQVSVQEFVTHSHHASTLFTDVDSLSDSDDEDAFLLAVPSALEEEKQMNMQRSKQRRLYSSMLETNKPLASNTSLASNAQTSYASLLGIGFVPSSSSLLAMDRGDTICGNRARLQPQLAVKSMCREESMQSIGLALDGGGMFSNLDGSRDLVTPPAMPTQARSPPPLSPRTHS